MTNEIKVFENQEFGSIRTLTENDKTLFCASDVAKALGYARPNDAISQHCRGTVKRSTPISGKLQDINFVPESDVYRLIFKSKLPSAERFEKWVMEEVLPLIRKHGAYMTPSVLEKSLLDPDYLIQLANIIKDEREKVKVLEEKNTVLTEENEVLKPKATYCDMVLQAPTAVPISIIAKDYGMSATQLNKLLHDFHVQYKVNGTWLLYQEYADCGYVKTSSHVFERNDGTTDCKVYTKWTQAGRMFIYNVLKANNIHPIMEQNGGDNDAKKPRKFYPRSVQ